MSPIKVERLDKLLKKGTITKDEYNRRRAQQGMAAASAGLVGRRGASMRDSLMERLDKDYFVKSFMANLGAIFAPQDNEGVKVYDPLTLVHSDSQLYKSEFTMAPNDTGELCFSVLPSMKSLVSVHSGTARFGGSSYYPGGTASVFDCYKYTSISETAVAYRTVGTSILVTYEGSTLNDSGSLAWASFPSWRNTTLTKPVTYSTVASYDYAHTGPARDAHYATWLPGSGQTTKALVSPTDVRSDLYGSVTFAAEAINVNGSFPACDARLRVVIYSLYEVFSVDPMISGTVGSAFDHPLAANAAHHAAAHIIRTHKSSGSNFSWKNILGTVSKWAVKEGSSLLKSYAPTIKKYTLEAMKDVAAAAPLALMAL
jgi:hypothetical protein